MEPTARTGALAAAAGVLGAAALYLDAPAVLAPAAALSLFLLGRAGLLEYRALRVLDTCVLERTVAPEVVRQGGEAAVEGRLALRSPDGVAVTATDLLPAGLVAGSAGTAYREEAGGLVARYTVTPLLPGELGFRGLRLECADPFFRTSFDLAGPGFREPPVRVIGAFAERHGPVFGVGVGERESERRLMLRGQGIRAFRPYLSGDDMALIDWKLSAKHSRFFVREPTSQVGGAPLMVVDLPDASRPRDGEACDRLVSLVGRELEGVVREFGACSLLVLSDGAVIAYRHREQSLAELLRLVTLPRPAFSAGFYRVRDPVFLRRRVRLAERTGSAFGARLAPVLTAFRAGQAGRWFQEQVDPALLAAPEREITIYAVGRGDPGAINLLVLAADRLQKAVRVVLVAPEPGFSDRVATYGATRLEVA